MKNGSSERSRQHLQLPFLRSRLNNLSSLVALQLDQSQISRKQDEEENDGIKRKSCSVRPAIVSLTSTAERRRRRRDGRLVRVKRTSAIIHERRERNAPISRMTDYRSMSYNRTPISPRTVWRFRRVVI